ncbi:hypothetical protein ABID82_003374 [Methylobacterium sp. PvP062]|nr:hypothetical protein KHHGKMAE_0520 [Methylobacterium persicinum]
MKPMASAPPTDRRSAAACRASASRGAPMSPRTVWSSDRHFGHEALLDERMAVRRPFASIDEHDETLIAQWNAAGEAGVADAASYDQVRTKLYRRRDLAACPLVADAA